MGKKVKTPSQLFVMGQNCWVHSQAYHATPLIDCADYYRALHSVIVQAKRSIFILGWDIDSQTHLLRGEEERQATAPSVIKDLLIWKAKENPNLQIYLLRWDSSLAFSGERDSDPELIWSTDTPENISICLDNTIPICGSHHQKIVIVDDEIAFSGGMDIARERWDERSHNINEPRRKDINGPYAPYHDAQVLVDGPIVSDLAKLARWRWVRATGFEPIAMQDTRPRSNKSLVPLWPKRFSPLFRNIDCAIARTIPSNGDDIEVHEVCRMYIDLIRSAEKLIYIENQFLTNLEIAKALNHALKTKPNLQILIVSSYNPKGLFEREGMWAGRILFRDVLFKDVDPGRVRLTYCRFPLSNGEVVYKRIHSKIMIIDDCYLVIGSSNLTDRSMSIDTECDLIFAANNSEEKRRISYLRNDLISEHSSLPVKMIAKLIDTQALATIVNSLTVGKYHLHDVDDQIFTNQELLPVAKVFADPNRVLGLGSTPFRNPSRQRFYILIAFIVIGILAFLQFKNYFVALTPKKFEAFLIMSRNSGWAFPLVIGLYILGGIIFFPVTVLSLMTAAIFGNFWGPIYGVTGALASAALMFGIGRLLGSQGLRRFFGDKIRTIDHHFREAGIMGVAIIRMLPLAPYSLVNMAAGVSSVRFFDFMIGSLLGFLPTFLIKGLVGDSMTQVFLNPNLHSFIYFCLGMGIWFGTIAVTYLLTKNWRKRRPI